MSCFAGSRIDVRIVRMNGNSNAVLKYFLTDENSDRNGDQICVLRHKTSPSGNRTLVSRATGGDTHHQGTIHNTHIY